jgi:hypothetical protein
MAYIYGGIISTLCVQRSRESSYNIHLLQFACVCVYVCVCVFLSVCVFVGQSVCQPRITSSIGLGATNAMSRLGKYSFIQCRKFLCLRITDNGYFNKVQRNSTG